jgi:AraC-like DNA-binding protein
VAVYYLYGKAIEVWIVKIYTVEMKHNQQFNYIFKSVLGYLNERKEADAKWLLDLDLDPNIFVATPELITERQLFMFCGQVMEHMDIPELGLLLGERYKVLQIGVIGFTQYTAPTIRHAAVITKTYQKIISSYVNVHHLFSRDLVTFRFEFLMDAGELRRFFIELELVAYIQAIRELANNPDMHPVEVRFDFPRPTYADKYSELTQCPVKFNTEFIELCFDINDFDLPIPTHDPVAHRMMLGLCNRLLHKLDSKTDLVTQCKEVIRDKIESNPSIEIVAKVLGVSRRTLSRHLSLQGINYKTLAVDIRIERARHYMKTTSLTLQKISELCGFTSNNSFSHLFKRKYGITPSQYRAKQV